MLGSYSADGKKKQTTIVYWGHIVMVEKKMETTIVYWGCIGIMEKKMETNIVSSFPESIQSSNRSQSQSCPG